MSSQNTVESTVELSAHPERETLEGKNKLLGFWFFLGGETVLFASFFGAFVGLRNQTASGPTSADIIHLDLVAVATFILLISSLTSVLGVIAMQRNQFSKMQFWFTVTVLLGLSFLILEIYEFYTYTQAGLGYTTSAFSAAF